MAMSRSDTQMYRRLQDSQSPADSSGRSHKKSNDHSPPPALATFNLNELKVAILGYSGVGKTAFIVRFLTRRFIGEYCRGIEAKYKCSVSVDGEIVHLQILDSSLPMLVGGYDRSELGIRPGPANVYVRINESIIEWADAFILVYSITSHRSFQVIKEMRKQICEQYALLDNKICNKPVMMLLGNKADLEHFREIDSKTADMYADQKNDLVFYELSTSNSPDDVQRCMYSFIRLARVRMQSSLTNHDQQQRLMQQQQHIQQQQQQQDQQLLQQQHQNGNQKQQNEQQMNNLASPTAQASTTAAASATSDSGAKSAKTFLLNKMFGGMMKQAKQAASGITGSTSPSGFNNRRSGDSSSGLVNFSTTEQ